MLDPKYIRENKEKVEIGVKNKGYGEELVNHWLKIDQKWRKLLEKIEALRAKRNKLNEVLKSRQGKPPADLLKQGKTLKNELIQEEEKLAIIEKDWKKALWKIPNIPADDVHVGRSEKENKVVETWGKTPKFSFGPKDYHELGKKLGLVDVKRASKVSGSRFGYLEKEAVFLEFALVQLALETLVPEGFIPVIPPVLIKKRMEAALGYAEHGGWKDMYELKEDGLVLVATAEHSLAAMHAQETIDERKLPLRYIGFSTCFRREAGSYGKDTRGIFRVHQFDKVEMLALTKPENSDKEHEYLVSLEKKLMQLLELPHQVVKMCTADLGQPTVRKYDIETWFPSEKKYRETHSCSNCTDYQSRRLGIKYQGQGKTSYVHLLNGTAFAVGRTILAILENYQQKDGSVLVPQVLQKWMGKEKIAA